MDMPEFENTEYPPIFNIPKENESPFKLPKKKGIFQPPPVDPTLQMKWGLALLGEEKAKAYLAWIEARLDANAQ